jgi:hypothetical protein
VEDIQAFFRREHFVVRGFLVAPTLLAQALLFVILFFHRPTLAFVWFLLRTNKRLLASYAFCA